MHTTITRVIKRGGTNEIVKKVTFDYTNKVVKFLVKVEIGTNLKKSSLALFHFSLLHKAVGTNSIRRGQCSSKALLRRALWRVGLMRESKFGSYH